MVPFNLIAPSDWWACAKIEDSNEDLPEPTLPTIATSSPVEYSLIKNQQPNYYFLTSPMIMC